MALCIENLVNGQIILMVSAASTHLGISNKKIYNKT